MAINILFIALAASATAYIVALVLMVRETYRGLGIDRRYPRVQFMVSRYPGQWALGISYTYLRGWKPHEPDIPFDTEGEPNEHIISLHLIGLHFIITLETGIPQ